VEIAKPAAIDPEGQLQADEDAGEGDEFADPA
jgi:hypothetical protein